MEKQFISARELLEDSFRLGAQVFNSGFKPDFIVGIWRGGTPVGIAVQEFLQFVGIETDHIAIRTSSYSGMGKRDDNIRVHGLHYIVENVNADDALLIVDDIFDTGLSIQAMINELQDKTRKNMPGNIRVACPWFKPANNKTTPKRLPDYYLHETDKWLVFPHELEGLNMQEIEKNKPEVAPILQELRRAERFRNSTG
jgi:hypoxanthine phosphoribosyltransferase